MAQEPARMAVFRKLQMPAQCGSVPERPPNEQRSGSGLKVICQNRYVMYS
jgi:hypothetical protein